jgi:hypothetical protein
MPKRDTAALRGVRERLKAELAELDRLGERMAALELNATIEILNQRLGEETDPAEIANLERRYFSD